MLSDTFANNGSGDRLECLFGSGRDSGRDTAKGKGNGEEVKKLHDG